MQLDGLVFSLVKEDEASDHISTRKKKSNSKNLGIGTHIVYGISSARPTIQLIQISDL